MSTILVSVENELSSSKYIIDSYSKSFKERMNCFLSVNYQTIDNWASCRQSYYVSSREQLNHLLSDFHMMYGAIGINHFPFDQVAKWYQSVKEDEKQHLKDGHKFNVFSLLADKYGFYFQETMHSRLLKFFLDETEMHGQGNSFLISFLNKLNVYAPELGKWNVTAEVGRIDLLIERKRPESIIVIENKSNWAYDQNNQIYRYWYQAIFSKTKETDESFYAVNSGKYQIIYLAPQIHKEISENSLSRPRNNSKYDHSILPATVPMEIKKISFDDFIQDWFEECINLLTEDNHSVREFINQYKTHCKYL